MPAATQSTAVPVADKSAARKPLIIAGITIVVLVAVTLALFFVDIQTAGKAIATGKASLNQGGIFLDEATEEVGKVLSIPVKVNIGDKKSVAFEFEYESEEGVSSVGDGWVDLAPIAELLVPDGVSPVTVQKYLMKTNKGKGAVKVAWLCADADCSNALTGEKIIATLQLVGVAEGLSAITFTSFNVYDLETNADLIKDGAAAEIVITKKEEALECASQCDVTKTKCFAENPGEKSCQAERDKCVLTCRQDCNSLGLFWGAVDEKCYSSCPTGTVPLDVSPGVKVCRAPSSECTDTDIISVNDGGSDLQKKYYVNYNVKGTVSGMGLWNDEKTTKTDGCFSATEVAENYCMVLGDYKYWGGEIKSCPSGTTCQDGACVLSPLSVCDATHLSLCTAENSCLAAGGSWDGRECVGGALLVDADGDGVDDVEDQCLDTPAGTAVDHFGCPLGAACAVDNLPLCLDQPSCSAVAGLWYKNACISICPAPASVGSAVAEDGRNEYQTCILPAAECNKNDPASCTTANACNKVGLLWTEAARACSACAAGTKFDPDSKSCVAVVKKKINIEMLDLNKNLVAKAAKLKAKDTYTVKVTIVPEKVLPADHLVLVKISYGSVVKTTFVDKKAAVDVSGEEKVEFTHDVAPEFKGSMTVDVFVWNNWPSLSGIWEALLPEGGNEQEGGSVTYAVE